MSIGRLMKELKRPKGDLLITPTVEAWLRRHGGPVLDAEGLELLKGIADRAQGNSGTQARSGRFGASSRGTCPRRQVFAFLGMPPLKLLDPELINLFSDGNWRHMRWQVMGLQSGFLTHAEWPAVMKKYRVKVSMDGLNASEGWLFELKGDRNPSRMISEPDPKHMLQIHTMLLVTGYDRAAYIVEDKLSQEWRERVIHRDEALIAVVREELEYLNECVDERRLPEVLPACSQGEGPYKSCPFAQQCLARHKDLGDQWPDEPGNWES